MVRIGFIGAGMVSELHKRAIDSVEDARLAAIYGATDADRKRAEEWGVKYYRDLAAFFKEVDAVYVLTPVEHHAVYALNAIDSGKPVFIEKPVAANSKEVEQIAARARAKKIPCMPGHNYIYDPSIWRIRGVIDTGDLGRLSSIWIIYTIYHTEEIAAHYPGIVQQILTHHFYVLNYLVGLPRRVAAMTTSLHYENLDRDDQALVMAEMQNGALACLFASFAADDDTVDPWTFLVKVFGTSGSAMHSWRELVVSRAIGTHSKAFIPYEESYAFEDEYFITRCLNGEEPLSTIEDAANIQKLVEKVQQSASSASFIDAG
jgi:predicted dehydrogenase